MSPGWQSSTLQMAFRVENRTAFALLFFKMDRLAMEDVGRFYVAGAFGTHIDKESAVTIGMYPDIDRDKIISPGNTSLQGARKLLLDRSLREKAEENIERMQYVQFGAVEEFLEIMRAAQAIPHTDLQRFPTVERRLLERQKKIEKNS